jgi:6-phosphogluconolactonase (cycloisomerase 2 family)
MNLGPHCVWVITGLAALAIKGHAHAAEANPLGSLRTLYAVNQAASSRGSIAVYDIDGGHRLLKTIQTVPEVHNVKGVAASAVTGKLYVSYYDRAGVGMIYCLDLANDTVLWNRRIDPGVDRLAVHPDGQLLYVPTGEDNTTDHINVVDANTGDIVRKVYLSKRSHDTQYPLSGPLFQETKAEDGSGNYLYQIDPKSYAVSRVGPYSGILGPYAVDNASRYVVNNVTGLWGMQVADLKTGRIATAELAEHPGGSPGLMHGIGWTPDEREVWQSGTWQDPHVYLWDMHDPVAPVLKQTLALRSGRGSHWLTFTIQGDYAYIAPNKNSDDGTEIFDVRTHDSVGVIGSTEDMLEIDFQDARVKRVGDQYGIGRRNDLIR